MTRNERKASGTHGLVLTALLLSTGCLAPPVEAPETTVVQTTPIRVAQTPQNKVDVLFMVDNSASMAAMQDQLKQHFADFFQVFEDLANKGTYADLQIGVVTSDYGAGNVAGGGCDASPGGQKGILQKLGKAADASCVAPNDGSNFIKFAFGATGNTSNLAGGSDPTQLVSTFTCMASGIATGGQAGCGFEHQLESVYAALHNTVENAGFLRPDALLTIVFVTNEDDGSAPPTATFYAQNAPPADGAFTTYRQTQFGVQCGSPEMMAPYAASAGMLSACEAAPNPMDAGDLEYDISRYVNYLTLSSAAGGVKPNPADVILVAIDAPETPFQTILAQTGTGGGGTPNPSYVPCSAVAAGTCEVHLQHSCQNMADPAFFGDPPVRLNAVVNAAKYHQVANICGDDLSMPPDYTTALQNLGNLITSNIGQGCIPEKVQDPTMVDCIVNDDTPLAGGTVSQAELSSCTQTGGQTPCWTVEMKPACATLSPQGIGVTVNRGGTSPPAGTYLDVECSTIAAQES